MKSYMWCLVNKRTKKIVKIRVGFEHGRYGPNPRKSYAVGFGSKRAVVDEGRKPYPNEEIKRISFEY